MNINKKIIEENLQVFTFFDKESLKVQETPASVVITVMIQPVNVSEFTDQYIIGVSVKKAGDQHIARIGNTIAFRDLMAHGTYVDITESKYKSVLKYLFENLNTLPAFTKLDKKTLARVKNIIALEYIS